MPTCPGHKVSSRPRIHPTSAHPPCTSLSSPLPHQTTELAGSTSIIFTRTCDSTRKIALTLRNLGFGAVPIHGQMSQPKRLGALNKFKARGCTRTVGGCCRGSWDEGRTCFLLVRPRHRLTRSMPPRYCWSSQAGDRNILIATDVASRGLDIPSVSGACAS